MIRSRIDRFSLAAAGLPHFRFAPLIAGLFLCTAAIEVALGYIGQPLPMVWASWVVLAVWAGITLAMFGVWHALDRGRAVVIGINALTVAVIWALVISLCTA